MHKETERKEIRKNVVSFSGVTYVPWPSDGNWKQTASMAVFGRFLVDSNDRRGPAHLVSCDIADCRLRELRRLRLCLFYAGGLPVCLAGSHSEFKNYSFSHPCLRPTVRNSKFQTILGNTCSSSGAGANSPS